MLRLFVNLSATEERILYGSPKVVLFLLCRTMA